VYFDTSGVSPYFIARFIELVGSKKLVFGSDALYNKMIYSIYFIYKASILARSKESREDIMLNILGRNFQDIMEKTRYAGSTLGKGRDNPQVSEN